MATAIALGLTVPAAFGVGLNWAAAVLGLAGTLASAAIYLVKARPAWNMKHTPLDFVLTGALLGSLLAVALEVSSRLLPVPGWMHLSPGGSYTHPQGVWLVVGTAALWALNQVVRTARLRGAAVFESRAAFSLLSSERFRLHLIGMALLVAASVACVAAGHEVVGLACGFGGTLLARYLFFVSVVPLNMALTFVRSRHA